jgi:dihydrofolate reductase
MRTLNFGMHVSLDGYYADNNNDMRWVHMDDFVGEWVQAMVDRCDTVIYGRVTFQMMEAFWPNVAQYPGYATSRHLQEHAEWVNVAKKIVVTRTLHNSTWHNTHIIRENVVESIKALKQEPGKQLLMLGSATLAQLLMSHGLIDDYWLTINPMTLGAGQPLFRQPLKLKLIDTDTRLFPNGSIGVHYVPA